MENNKIDSLINSFTLLSAENNVKKPINFKNNNIYQYINNLYNENQNIKIKIIQKWFRKRLNKICIKFV